MTETSLRHVKCPGLVGNVVGHIHINKVVLRWVTIGRWVNHLGM